MADYRKSGRGEADFPVNHHSEALPLRMSRETLRLCSALRTGERECPSQIALEQPLGPEPEEVPSGPLLYSYRSRALSLGKSLPMIQTLLGHRKDQTTIQYAHHPQGSVKAAANRLSDSVVFDLHTLMTAQVAI